MNAVVIDNKDTVAVAIEEIKKGDPIEFSVNGEVRVIEAIDDIKIYHKVAIERMAQGEPVVKYGEHIGLAGQTILQGAHVHEHNVQSHREEL